MTEEKSIFYRPEIAPEKNYLSEGVFQETGRIPLKEDEEESAGKVKALILEFKELTDLVSLTVPEVAEVVVPITQKLEKRLEVVFPKGFEDRDLPEITAAVPERNKEDEGVYDKAEEITSGLLEKTDSGMEDYGEIFPEPTNIELMVETPKTYIKIVSGKYKKDILELEEHYLHCLQTAFQRFYQQALCVMAECGIEDIEHITKDIDGEAVFVGNPNLMHLKDEIIRSQIIRDQKIRLLKKTHNADCTVLQLRQWEAAEQCLERYYGEKLGGYETYINTESNGLLAGLQKKYEKNYCQALFNVYKYLNSSVIKMEDILEMCILEIKAKGKLLDSGINIFAVTGSTQR